MSKIYEEPILPADLIANEDGGAGTQTQYYKLTVPPLATSPIEIEAGGTKFTWQPSEILYRDENNVDDYIVQSLPSHLTYSGLDAKYSRTFINIDDLFTAQFDRIKHCSIIHSAPRPYAEYLSGKVQMGITGNISGIELPVGIHTKIEAHPFILPEIEITDAVGRQITGTYEITDNQQLIIWFDATFLNEASYPIVVDPTVVVTAASYGGENRAAPMILDNGWIIVTSLKFSTGFNFYVSKDSGATFTLLTTGRAAYHVSTCFIGTTVYVAYSHTGYLRFLKFDATTVGTSLAEGSTLYYTNVGSIYDPSIAAYDANNIAIAWSCYNATYSSSYFNICGVRSRNGGDIWRMFDNSSPGISAVTNSTTASQTAPWISFMETSLVISYMDESGWVKMYRYDPLSTNYVAYIGTGFGAADTIILTKKYGNNVGRRYVAFYYYGSTSKYYVQVAYTDNGTSFTTILSSIADETYPTMCEDPLGNIQLLTVAPYPDTATIYRRILSDGSNTFSSRETISTAAGVPYFSNTVSSFSVYQYTNANDSTTYIEKILYSMQYTKDITTTVLSNSSLTHIAKFYKTLSSTVRSLPVDIRQIRKYLTETVMTIGSRALQARKSLKASSKVSTSFSYGQSFAKLILALVKASAKDYKSIKKYLATSVLSSVSLVKAITKKLTTKVNAIESLKKLITKLPFVTSLSATSTNKPGLIYNKTFTTKIKAQPKQDVLTPEWRYANYKNIISLVPGSIAIPYIVADTDLEGIGTYAPVAPNTTYTLSILNPTWTSSVPAYIKVGFFKSINDVFNSSKCFSSFSGTAASIGSLTFKTPAECYAVVVAFYAYEVQIGSILGFADMQTERGSTATNIVAVNDLSYRVDLPKPLYRISNTIYDSVDLSIGKAIYRTNKATLNGTEAWALYTIKPGSDVNTIGFTLALPDMVNDIASNTLQCISNKFISVSADYLYANDIECIAGRTGIVRIRVSKSRLSTANVTGLKSWLASNPVDVLYELATYIEEDITVPTIKTQNPSTSIYSSDQPLTPLNATFRSELWNMQSQITQTAQSINAIINDNDTRISNLELLSDEFSLSFSNTGIVNKVKNSGALNTAITEEWQVSNESAITTVDALGDTASGKSFCIHSSGTQITMQQTLQLVNGKRYSLSFRSRATSGTYTISLNNTVLLTSSNITVPETWDDHRFIGQIVASYNDILLISYTGTNGDFYISDIMLIEGDVAYGWTQAPGELYTANMKVNNNGIQFTTNKSDLKTVMSDDSFSVQNKNTNKKLLEIGATGNTLGKTVFTENVAIGNVSLLIRDDGLGLKIIVD